MSEGYGKANSEVGDALERFRYSMEHEAEFREQAKEDLDFVMGNQWPAQLKSIRENDSENGPRPCLVMDKLSQYSRQVINDTRQNRPAIKVRAVEDGDTGVATVIQGLTRNTEDVSRADIAYDRALEGATHVGRGWLRLTTQYVAEDTSFQEPRVMSIPDHLSVVPDCTYQEPDGSDMEYGFVVVELSKDTYRRQYPKAAISSMDYVEGWASDESVRIAEYFCIHWEEKKLLTLADSGMELFEDGLEDVRREYGEDAVRVNSERMKRIPRVKWQKINCHEVLEETDWLGRWIPLIPVHGNEVWKEGKRHLSGLVRLGKDPQRLYNYSRSAFAELIALAPKVPFTAAEGQIEGYEDQWQSANRVARSYLPYKPISIDGHIVPPPQRQPFAGVPAGLMQDMTQAEHDIQSSLGMYAPSIGQPSNERSGKAILARQREGDVGSFHYRDNLGRSIRHLGRMLVDLYPKVYDTRRVLRIIGEDGIDTQVVVDPQTQQPVTEVRKVSGEVQKIYNLGLGQYDVTISSGPGYATQREESAQAMLQLTQAAPQLFGVIGDLMVKSMDWPYAEEISRRLQLLLPPALKPEGEGKKPLPPEAQQKIQQLTQTLQMLGEKMKELQQEYAKMKGIVDGKVIDKQMKETEAAGKVRELEFKMEELAVKREELEVERMRIASEADCAATEGLMKIDERDSKEREAQLKVVGERESREFERESSAQKLQMERESFGMKSEQERAKGEMALAQTAAKGEAQAKVPGQSKAAAGPTLEQIKAAMVGALKELLPQLEEMIEGAQTVIMVPEIDASGNVVGGTAVQANGKERKVTLRREQNGNL